MSLIKEIKKQAIEWGTNVAYDRLSGQYDIHQEVELSKIKRPCIP